MNLNGLNDMQKRAVKQTEGPVLVIAGAGSGKTRVLTQRIAYLIEECNVDPYHILAITFTNKAATEMRERVNKVAGDGADQIWVSTFHSTCVRILRRFADRIGYTVNFTIYDTDDQKSLVREACKKLNIDTKMFKERQVLSAISSAKDEMMTPDEMEIQAGADYRQKRMAVIYREYQEALKRNNAMDFDDLIFKTVSLLQQDEEVRTLYQERFRYIMVDEYQDTNTVQFRLISILADRYKNLCVVGDDDQSIYKFRGANIGNILHFESTFPGAKVIKLEQNYRSTQTILDAANAVIRNNVGRKGKTLWTSNGTGDKIHFQIYDDAYKEAEGVVSSIAANVRDGWNYNDIAILYRTNAQSRALEEKLMIHNIPYRIYGGVNFYQRKEIKDILAYLKTIDNGMDGQAVKRIINVPKRGIGATTIERVQHFADQENISFWSALCHGSEIPDIGRAWSRLEPFVTMIQGFQAQTRFLSIRELTEKVLEDIHYMDALEDAETKEEIQARQENIGELINKIVSYEEESQEQEDDAASDGQEEIRKKPTLSGFLEEVALIADIDNLDQSSSQVMLMTLHSAKGLEFPIVYMTGMEDGLFPGYMSIMADDPTELEEERRLCYVGITRAMKELHLSYAKQRMVRGEMQMNKVSQFVREIPEEFVDIENLSYGYDTKNVYKKDKAESAGSYSGGSVRTQAKAALNRYSMGTQGNYDSLKRRTRIQGSQTGRSGESAQSAYGGKAVGGTPGGLAAKFGLKTNYGSRAEVPVQKNKKVGFGKEFPMDLFDLKKPAGRTADAVSQSGGKSAGLGYEVGDTVESQRFGRGKVLKIQESARDYMVQVDFEEIGLKQMLAGFANLKKI